MDKVLDRLTIGDCRRHSALERAGIASCRAVLFTTGDERANITGALAARSLDPSIRLVIRSSQTNLNLRLDQRLGNLMALDFGLRDPPRQPRQPCRQPWRARARATVEARRAGAGRVGWRQTEVRCSRAPRARPRCPDTFRTSCADTRAGQWRHDRPPRRWRRARA